MLAPDTDAERMRLYRQGLPDQRIARMQGVHRTAICQWRNQRGLKAQTPRKIVGPIGTRRDLYEAGLSDGQVAVLEGVTRATIQEWREWYDLPTKLPRGPACGRQRRIALDSLARDTLTQMHERIGDPKWSGWLEEMGATVW